jgi:tetraacyldisaccharide 4'-kinase
MKPFVEKMMQRAWNEDARQKGTFILRPLLGILSFPYEGAVFLRNAAYDRHLVAQKKLPCPVISIGNLTVGGTGKTPTAIMLAALLKGRGYHPAVLSRGYRGKTKSSINVVSDGKGILMDWRDAGDEPVLIAQSLPGIPVLAGTDRFVTGMAAVERFGANVLILDDAFQHRRLFRDIDIVLLDAMRPLGNGFLLPRGTLRERPSSLGRADILLRTGVAEETEFLPGDIALPSFWGVHQPTGIVSGKTGRIEPPGVLQGQKVFAFSGIGSPEAFRKSLAALGADVVSCRDFPDHHPYSDADMEELRRLAAPSGASCLITTEKDAVRLADFPDFLTKISLLRISMEITPLAPFTELILSRLPH